MNVPFLDPETIEKRRKQAKFRAALVRWHRYIGIGAAIFVLILSVTGILLSHAEKFRLHESTISPVIAEILYDTTPASVPVGQETNEGWLVWLDGSLYLDGISMPKSVDALYGVIQVGNVIAVAGPSEILLYTQDGQFIEKLSSAVLPSAIDRIGLTPNGSIITEWNGTLHATNAEFLDWTEVNVDRTDIDWSTPTSAMPQIIRETVLSHHGIAEIKTHRFIADLHSGRSFGPWGPLIMDIAAILLIALSFSGLYIWWRQRKARLQNKRLMPPAE